MSKLLLGVVTVLFLFSNYAFCEAKIATIKFQQAMLQVEDGKKARAQLEKEFQPKSKKKEDMEKEIKKIQDDFEKQKGVLSKEAMEQKQKDYQEKMYQYQAYITQSNNELQEKEKQLSAPIIDGLRKLIADFAKEKGYSLVIDNNESIVMYAANADDITDEVVKRFNSKKKK